MEAQLQESSHLCSSPFLSLSPYTLFSPVDKNWSVYYIFFYNYFMHV